MFAGIPVFCHTVHKLVCECLYEEQGTMSCENFKYVRNEYCEEISNCIAKGDKHGEDCGVASLRGV